MDSQHSRSRHGARTNGREGIPSTDDAPESAWAQRLQRAHISAVENLVLFASLVLILNAEHDATDSTGDRLRQLFLGVAQMKP